MKIAIRIILGALATGYYIGCAPAKFEKDLSVNPCQNSGQNCIVTPDGRDYFTINRTTSGGLVDILIVTDNSASMSTEQNQMANKFDSFIQALDNKLLDYRIGVITTDIRDDNPNSARYNPKGPANKEGEWQDGKLIEITAGKYFITHTDNNKVELFRNIIKRNETVSCENWLKNADQNAPGFSAQYRQKCPSGDERGIYAANKFIKYHSSNFIRQNAHLAIVFLTDEDVGSSLYNESSAFKLELNDLPSTLVNNVRQKFGSKSFSAHSIIVQPGSMNGSAEEVERSLYAAKFVSSCGYLGCIEPQATSFFSSGNLSCLSAQKQQLYNTVSGQYIVSASYGYMYSILTKMTNGIEGDICANDYGSQLYNIGSNIVDRVSDIQLACSNPQDLQVQISDPSVQWRVEGSLLKFTPEVLPPGVRVTGDYYCIRY